MHDLGIGTMRNMQNVISGIFLPSLFFTEYSLADKINLWRAKQLGHQYLLEELINHDLMQESTSFKIPVYFLHGVFDYTCSYELAKEYYEKIEAPSKGFYSFEHSAHSPLFEEPDEMMRIIKTEILLRYGNLKVSNQAANEEFFDFIEFVDDGMPCATRRCASAWGRRVFNRSTSISVCVKVHRDHRQSTEPAW